MGFKNVELNKKLEEAYQQVSKKIRYLKSADVKREIIGYKHNFIALKRYSKHKFDQENPNPNWTS